VPPNALCEQPFSCGGREHARKRIGVGRDHLGHLSQSRSRPRTDKHEPASEVVRAMTIAGSKRVVIVMRYWRASQIAQTVGGQCPRREFEEPQNAFGVSDRTQLGRHRRGARHPSIGSVARNTENATPIARNELQHPGCW
jgi:hypothetical protein